MGAQFISGVAKRIFFAAEEGLQQVFSVLHKTYATASARLKLRRKSDLRGHRCHCPPNMPVHLVHSEGLREGADFVVDFGSNVRTPKRPQIPVPELVRVAGGIESGDVIHVKSDLIGQFVEYLLPHIQKPFVLVTGDSDYPPVGAHSGLLRDSRLIHWFAQNCDVPWRHEKLTRIPIGIDNPRYQKLEKRIGFLIDMALGKSPVDFSFSRNDMGDQKLLQEIGVAGRGNIANKPVKALCTFHMNQKLVPNFEEIPDRAEAYELLKDNPDCTFVTHRLLQEECWRVHDEYAFEISPRGKGLDCFRTWEAIFLGTIPIVKTTSLDPLYIDENLPVVIVQSFSEVTRENLQRWKEEMAPRFTPALVEKLTNDYWLKKIRAAAAPYRS